MQIVAKYNNILALGTNKKQCDVIRFDTIVSFHLIHDNTSQNSKNSDVI